MSEQPNFHDGITTPDDEILKEIIKTKASIEIIELEYQFSDFKDEAFNVAHFAALQHLADFTLRLKEYYAPDDELYDTADDPEL